MSYGICYDGHHPSELALKYAYDRLASMLIKDKITVTNELGMPVSNPDMKTMLIVGVVSS